MVIDAFAIVLNEEELISYMLDSFVSLGGALGTLSLVDNGSTDRTLQIIERYRDRLNIVLQHDHSNSHHGRLRTKALEPLTAPWIFYLDSDETFTLDFKGWLESGNIEKADVWDIFKYTTILDRYHYVEGGNGPSTRLFRNLPGVHFPQNIHTEPTHPGLVKKDMIPGVTMFDHTACKSQEALWAKGWRYQWAQGTVGIGPIHEYVFRVQDAMNKRDRVIREFTDPIRSLIFTGPRAHA